MVRVLYVSVALATLASSGCGLVPVPYVADVSGSITGLRVVDMHSSEDIADASASFVAGIAETNWMRCWPPHLAAVSESEKGDETYDGPLDRDASGVFPVTKRYGLGFVRPFGIGPLGWALHNPAIGVVRVTAPGYPAAFLACYCGKLPEPGWSAAVPIVRVPVDGDDAPSDGDAPDAVRCRLDPDGTLWFYLRREEAETGAELATRPR